jgi:hypothetical protein
MAASALLWSAIDSIETWIVGTTSGLRNLASSTNVLGSEIDNDTATTKRRPFARLQLHAKYASAPAAGDYIALWFLPRQDNSSSSSYEDGDSSTTPVRAPDVIFPLRATTSQQHITQIAPVPPGYFKVLLRNNAGQALANANDTDSILKAERFSPEAQ